MTQKKETNQFIGIASSLGVAMIGITALVVLFASSTTWIIAPVALFLALLGVFLGYFASKK